MNLRNKNILLIIHHGVLGGAERQGLGLSKILTNEYSCNVDLLLTFSDKMGPEFEDFARESRIRNILHFQNAYLYFPPELSIRNFRRLKWSIEYLLLLRKHLKPMRYDVIFPFLNFPSKLAFYLYKILPTVKFTFWHQLGLDKWSKDFFEIYAAKNIPCLIANSSTGIQLFEEHYEVEESKKFVLPQYLSLEFHKFNSSQIKSHLDLPSGQILIGMVAQYRYDKYHELLLECFKLLVTIEDNVHLVFLGNKMSTSTTEKKFNSLKKNIQAAGLEHKVSLLTNKKVEHVLSVLDIGVLVSKIEGMPNAVMEYMAYGLPVVASDHPGCRYLLEEGKNGFLVNNEVEEVLKALLHLIRNPDLRKSMGKMNRIRISEFTPESYIEDFHLIMNQIIADE